MDLIRDSLFSIQVKQPWLLLQYGNSDVESIGADRVESLLSTSPDENNGQDREEIVVEEIEDRENTNLTVTWRLTRGRKFRAVNRSIQLKDSDTGIIR